MSARVIHTAPASWPDVAPGRFAATIRRDSPDGCSVALLGLPDDTGVTLNYGRPGAAEGPSAIRAGLASYGTPWDSARQRALATAVFDAGDVEPSPGAGAEALLATHERVESAARELHARGLTVIGLGGGHDLSLPTIRALANAIGAPVAGINVDAHLDVRERIGSGMPFRRLIEGAFLDGERFVEVGLGRFVNDASDEAWLRARGATLIGRERADTLDATVALASVFEGARAGFVSIDLDVLDASVMPAVSALNPQGLGVARVADWAEAAGREPKVRHFDVMELSPPWDSSGRGARVAAYLILRFLAGFEERVA